MRLCVFKNILENFERVSEIDDSVDNKRDSLDEYCRTSCCDTKKSTDSADNDVKHRRFTNELGSNIEERRDAIHQFENTHTHRASTVCSTHEGLDDHSDNLGYKHDHREELTENMLDGGSHLGGGFTHLDEARRCTKYDSDHVLDDFSDETCNLSDVLNELNDRTERTCESRTSILVEERGERISNLGHRTND